MSHYPTRVRYGLRLLVRLALQSEARHLSIGEIALEEGVSVKYLEQIVSLLKPLGILTSVRGARGGYALVRDASEISMAQVFESLGGLSPAVPCFDDPQICSRIEVCTTRPFWHDFDAHVRAFLNRFTLADIAARAPQGGVEFGEQFSATFSQRQEFLKASRARD